MTEIDKGWKCTVCGTFNLRGEICSKCGSPRGGLPSQANTVSLQDQSTWPDHVFFVHWRNRTAGSIRDAALSGQYPLFTLCMGSVALMIGLPSLINGSSWIGTPWNVILISLVVFCAVLLGWAASRQRTLRNQGRLTIGKILSYEIQRYKSGYNVWLKYSFVSPQSNQTIERSIYAGGYYPSPPIVGEHVIILFLNDGHFDVL